MPNFDDRLAEFSLLLEHSESLFDALRQISKRLQSMLGAERASVLLYDKKRHLLRRVAGEDEEMIVVPYDQGVVGESLRTGKVQLENEPYNSTNFFAEVDMQLGFYTQSILTIPLFNDQQNIIGVIELLNKKGGFGKDDKAFAETLSHALSTHIALAQKSITDETP